MTAAADPRTRPLNVRLVATAGEKRREALEVAEAALDAAVDELLEAGPHGAQGRITHVARELGVTRKVIYRRLELKGYER